MSTEAAAMLLDLADELAERTLFGYNTIITTAHPEMLLSREIDWFACSPSEAVDILDFAWSVSL